MNDADGMLISFSSETVTPVLGANEVFMDIQNSGLLEVINHDSANFEARMEMTQVLMGSEIEYIAYYRNNVLYVDLRETDLGFGVKHDIQPVNAFSLLNIHLDFSEDVILAQSVEEVDQGTQLSFSLNAESLLEVINGQLNTIPVELEQLDTMEYELIVVLDEDHIIQLIELSIQFTYEADGDILEISMNASLNISLSSNIIFEFPDDVDEFMEFGEGSLPIF